MYNSTVLFIFLTNIMQRMYILVYRNGMHNNAVFTLSIQHKCQDMHSISILKLFFQVKYFFSGCILSDANKVECVAPETYIQLYKDL